MPSIRHQLTIAAPIESVHRLIADAGSIALWWDAATAGEHDGQPTLSFTPGPGHGTLEMLVLENTSAGIRWRCISQHPESSPAHVWTGTEISFALSETGNGCRIDFVHGPWAEEDRWYGFCTYQWAMALQALKYAAEGAGGA